MRLSDFIIANIEPILLEWVAFARTILPAARDLNDLELRDDAESLLRDIATAMRTRQDEAQRLAKSYGHRERALTEPSYRSHATQRASGGFEITQMVSEYRALRASVLRLWKGSVRELDVHDLEDLTRFNEAMDQALAGSLKFFVQEVDRARHLFLGMLGHDLRTPLGSIVNCARYQMRSGPECSREAEMILRNATRMNALLNDWLAYIQMHLGAGMTIEPAPVCVGRDGTCQHRPRY